MPGYSDPAQHTMLDALGLVATHVSLHTADPGLTGAAEVVGGLYARKPVTYAAASASTKKNSAAIVHEVPASTVVTHFAIWSAATLGVMQCSGALDATQTYTTAGQLNMAVGALTLDIQ